MFRLLTKAMVILCIAGFVIQVVKSSLSALFENTTAAGETAAPVPAEAPTISLPIPLIPVPPPPSEPVFHQPATTTIKPGNHSNDRGSAPRRPLEDNSCGGIDNHSTRDGKRCI